MLLTRPRIQTESSVDLSYDKGWIPRTILLSLCNGELTCHPGLSISLNRRPRFEDPGVDTESLIGLIASDLSNNPQKPLQDLVQLKLRCPSHWTGLIPLLGFAESRALGLGIVQSTLWFNYRV